MIYIHIGLQKTGTTSLQFILNKEKLLTFPIDPVKNIKTKNHLFYSSGNQEFFYLCKRNNLKEIYFKNSSKKDIIISCENFTNPEDNLNSLRNLLNYLTKKVKKKFVIICTYREHKDYYKSMYAEAVTNSFACEMRLFNEYKSYIDKHIKSLNMLLANYPVKKFFYGKDINNKIFKYISGYDLVEKKLLNNKKNTKYNFEIKNLEEIAKRNRIKGWMPKYRFRLRSKHKKDEFQASFLYILLTYIRSFFRLMKIKFLN